MKMKRTKKTLSLCMALVFLLALLSVGSGAVAIVDSGYCGGEGDGTNLTWTLDSDGVLTISGTGEMGNYDIFGDDDQLPPWYSHRVGIVSAVIHQGVTGIGDYAFAGCESLINMSLSDGLSRIGAEAFRGCRITTLSLPESVTEIGSAAFFYCINLTELAIPLGVTSINSYMFSDCWNLRDVTIPDSVTSIHALAFCACSSLSSVTIPEGVVSIEYAAFRSCRNLSEIIIPQSVTRISDQAFGYCESLSDVYFSGSEKEWNQIAIEEENDFLLSASVHYGKSDFGDKIGYRYKVFQGEANSWEEARDYCLSIGGHLATLTSREENDYVFRMITEAGIWSAYFGFSDSVEEGVWTWVTGEPISFLNWAPGEPNGYGGENYGMFYGELSDGTWNDGSFSGVEDGTFICEWDTQEAYETVYLPTAARYVPYSEKIPATYVGGSFVLSSGALPEGLTLGSDGILSGIPTELGSFSFKVTETYDGGTVTHECKLSVFTQYSMDVEDFNEPGYGFVETVADDGRVQDQIVSAKEELTDQIMHLEGAFSEFRALYLDARQLTRNVDYYAEEGSTKLTVLAETIGEAGGGTHTLAAEFLTADSTAPTGSRSVYTVQNYTVAGIASREVHVTVEDELVLWTDAEPYIDTNNRTMTPFRAVGEALGLSVAWDSSTREASFTDGAKTIYFPIGSTTARGSDGSTVTMDTSAVIVNGRTYAPIRYLAEFFGRGVAWDAKTRTAIIK